jgi:Hexokinase
LTKWTKGFSASGVEGVEVVGLLNDAFSRKGLKIKVKAIVNDTVGTLISHSYSDPQTFIGGILSLKPKLSLELGLMLPMLKRLRMSKSGMLVI